MLSLSLNADHSKLGNGSVLYGYVTVSDSSSACVTAASVSVSSMSVNWHSRNYRDQLLFAHNRELMHY